MKDSSENDESTEPSTKSSDEPEVIFEFSEKVTEAINAPEPSEAAAEPKAMPAPEPVLAEPGIYVGEYDAGEHQLLGLIEHGKEYDYSAEQNPDKLAAIAACVESGLLRKA